jgi:hypothetical protein
MAVRDVLLVAGAFLLCLNAEDLRAQSGGWDTDERILISDFSVVTALARSPTQLFAATNGGLAVLDDAFGAFEPPITVEDGYPVAPVTALTFDHRDGSVWMAAGGELSQLDPQSRRFRDRIPIRQAVDELVPAGPGGTDLFVRLGPEWWRLDTFTRDFRRADRGAVRVAIESRSDLRRRREALQDGFFRDALDRVARDWDGRSLRVTDVMPGRQSWAWWVGTAGGFLFDYDDGSRDASRRAYGPLGAGMAAVAASRDEVWFAPATPLDGRYGVAAASRDLQSWRVWRADSSAAVPSGVRAVLSGSRGRWAGGESGLYWMARSENRWSEQRTIDLAVRPVLSLAFASGPDGRGIWVGTSRGAVRIPAPGVSPDIALLPADAITAVAEAGGVVWIGTGHGLYGFDLSDPDSPQAASRVAGPSALRLPVGALAVTGDTVFAGLDREVWWRTGRSGEWRPVNPVGRHGAPVTALALHEGILWAGSAAELTAWEVGGASVGRFRFGRDLPPDPRGRTGVWAIAPVSRGDVWLALPAGALLFETGF